MLYIKEDTDVLISSTGGRMLLLHTSNLTAKASKDTAGVAVMTQKKNQHVSSIRLYQEGFLSKPHRYRAKNLPAAGGLPSADDQPDQLKLI